MKKRKVVSWVLACILTGIISLVGCGQDKDIVDKDDEFRMVKIESYQGVVALERNETKKELFKGTQLISDDIVSTGIESTVELLVDSDKHILARENTEFEVKYEGKEKKGYFKIELLEGTSLVTIDEKLPPKSEFIVTTPNATLSVRGTEFETSYDVEAKITTVSVNRGIVQLDAMNKTAYLYENTSVEVRDGDIFNIYTGESVENNSDVTEQDNVVADTTAATANQADDNPDAVETVEVAEEEPAPVEDTLNDVGTEETVIEETTAVEYEGVEGKWYPDDADFYYCIELGKDGTGTLYRGDATYSLTYTENNNMVYITVNFGGTPTKTSYSVKGDVMIQDENGAYYRRK